MFRDYIEIPICTKLERRPCIVDQLVVQALIKCAEELRNDDSIKLQLGEIIFEAGTTISTNDFYEEQARTTGAICDHTEANKMEYLKQARERGVINIEMEANYLIAMCHKIGLRNAVVCVALNNRLEQESAGTSKEIQIYEKRLFALVNYFVRKQLDDGYLQ